ncbi:uncharacterized protein LOC123896162 [Trifolium pratense]|uniref:uncharacterized protein LOC123896162 n=1 Tax=Trifolium pratense TaxID=57577 RepID=UPI001E697A01|nr:uncharacterized protein LOC123896162 [Trifolium pratense]
MINKDWVELPPHSEGYKDGVDNFLDIGYTKGIVEGIEILCPCAICCNDSWKERDVVYDHLRSKGFVKGYTEWIYHGDDKILMDLDGDTNDETSSDSSSDDIDGLLFETFKDVAEGGVHEGLNEDARKFYKLVDDSNQELYPGCEKFSSLSFTIRMYLLKCLHGWSNASFTALLELLKEAMPELNIPVSFNKTKSMIKDLGLDYKKIHACPNNCMLFWKEYGEDDSCHLCGASRWIEYPEVDCAPGDSKKPQKVPAKVLRHFPLIPRLKRLFMCSKTADTLRWHAEERSRDGRLRHPADGQAWKDFDATYPDFSLETRNIRLGLASDGFNPFKTISLSHSTWPVVLTIYNYAPNLCLKAENCLMSLLIPGPHSPGNAIDVYMQPLIEELKILWDVGVETYDISKNESFQMRAALLWTVNDFPAYAMLSGWSTKGKFACPACNHKTSSTYLKHSKKMCYMGHRVFLDSNHVWRANAASFDGKTEYRSPPTLLSSKRILKDLKHIPDVLGKEYKKKRRGPWKKKSIFWQLPYWNDISLRHNLDVMHIEKNICDNIIGTLLEIEGKKKDHANARLDLQHMRIRKNLHLKATSDGKKTQIPKACCSLTKHEKSVFCGVLKIAKLPDGLASNISRCVQVNEGKISGYKSHDAHIILHYLLQVAIRGITPNQVSIPLIRLCSFFRCLCQKVIEVKTLDNLEVEIAETLCQLERIFPPSFFDIMVHLPIHLANEVRLGGPVQFRWMYYMERYLGDLKSFVRNRSRPEGSIAEAYLVKESLTFCSRYLSSGVDTRMNRMTRNSDDTPSIGHPIGGKKLISLDQKLQNQAHGYILFNCDEVQEYIRYNHLLATTFHYDNEFLFLLY